jgi:hypothetical protein
VLGWFRLVERLPAGPFRMIIRKGPAGNNGTEVAAYLQNSGTAKPDGRDLGHAQTTTA